MRVFKIDLPATLVSLDPDLDLSVEAVRQQLHRELDALTDELGDDVRLRVAAYFPPSYTTFVRLQLLADGTHAIATVWVDDPTVRWPSGLFARRAWTLSIPILSHIVKETFERRLPSVRIDIQERKAKIMSLAPARGWLDPVILAIVVALLSAGLWIIAYPWIVTRLAGS